MKLTTLAGVKLGLGAILLGFDLPGVLDLNAKGTYHAQGLEETVRRVEMSTVACNEL